MHFYDTFFVVQLGAEHAGLKKEYIDMLKSLPTYVPAPETLAKRASLPEPEDLPTMSVETLARHDGRKREDFPTHVAVMGYVFDTHPGFSSHRGRDITTRMLHQVNFLGWVTIY